MKLIVGLGNPGEKYKSNRHNVGFMLVDNLLIEFKDQNFKEIDNNKFKSEMAEVLLEKDKYIFVKPQTYMNESGTAVQKVAQFYKVLPKDIIVIHDDLDIPLGEYKIQIAKGPKIHNGLLSIENHLHTKDFMRVRIGVDNRSPERRTPGEEYVLSNFSTEETKVLKEVFKKIKAELFK